MNKLPECKDILVMLAIVAFACLEQGWVVVALCLLLLTDKSFKTFITAKESYKLNALSEKIASIESRMIAVEMNRQIGRRL